MYLIQLLVTNYINEFKLPFIYGSTKTERVDNRRKEQH